MDIQYISFTLDGRITLQMFKNISHDNTAHFSINKWYHFADFLVS